MRLSYGRRRAGSYHTVGEEQETIIRLFYSERTESRSWWKKESKKKRKINTYISYNFWECDEKHVERNERGRVCDRNTWLLSAVSVVMFKSDIFCRKLLLSDPYPNEAEGRIDVQYFAAGILSNLVASPISWEDSETTKEEVNEYIVSYFIPKDCVSECWIWLRKV